MAHGLGKGMLHNQRHSCYLSVHQIVGLKRWSAACTWVNSSGSSCWRWPRQASCLAARNPLPFTLRARLKHGMWLPWRGELRQGPSHLGSEGGSMGSQGMVCSWEWCIEGTRYSFFTGTISDLCMASSGLAVPVMPHMWLLVGFSNQGFSCWRFTLFSCFAAFFLPKLVT